MKTPTSFSNLLLLASCLLAPTLTLARQDRVELRYRFSGAQTNAYRVEIQMRSEAGQETTAGTIFVVPTDTSSNVVSLACHATLEVKRVVERFPGGRFGEMFPGGSARFPEGSEIQIDNRGHLLREAGDYPLPIPLGTLPLALVEPLPESPTASHWELSDESPVLDNPLWLGPVSGFVYSQFGPPFSPYLNYGPRTTMAVLMVSRHATYRSTAVTPDTITIHKQLTLHSLLKTGPDPRVSATGEGDLVFDRAAGLFKQIDMQCNTSASTETSLRNTKVSLKCRLLQGAELEAALAPPTPPVPTLLKPTAEELQKLMADLSSADLTQRRNAASRLNNAVLDSPPAELLKLVSSLSTDSDSSIRQSAANFLRMYGTTNEVPALLRLLRDPDWGTHQAAIKALGSIKDERAIGPLTDDIARGNSPFQQEAVSALIAIGTPAETAVLQMLQDRNTETRRQACRILQQIGTGKSVGPLQELVSNPDQSLSQSATEALRAIKYRE